MASSYTCIFLACFAKCVKLSLINAGMSQVPGFLGQLCGGEGWSKVGALTAAGLQWPQLSHVVMVWPLVGDVTFWSLSFFTIKS